jgi:hypothetical protein
MYTRIPIKRWPVLAYTICFSMLVIFVIKPYYSNSDLILLEYFETIIHLLVVVGAIFYGLELSNKYIGKYWKSVPFVYSLYLLISLSLEMTKGHGHGLLIDISVLIFIILINLPMIIFNYRFAFWSSKDTVVNSAGGLTRRSS